MQDHEQLTQALGLLGDLLRERGLSFDLVVIGGGALLLQNLIRRPTLDLDAVARVENDAWVTANPLPAPLIQAVRDVADALDLPREPRDEKDWLNSGPAFLQNLGLPEGFAERLAILRFGPLTIRVAARQDLVCLKLWAATDASRGPRRAVDIADLRALRPTQSELRDAVAWCTLKDGRPDFASLELAPLLEALGTSMQEVLDE